MCQHNETPSTRYIEAILNPSGSAASTPSHTLGPLALTPTAALDSGNKPHSFSNPSGAVFGCH